MQVTSDVLKSAVCLGWCGFVVLTLKQKASGRNTSGFPGGGNGEGEKIQGQLEGLSGNGNMTVIQRVG